MDLLIELAGSQAYKLPPRRFDYDVLLKGGRKIPIDQAI